MSRPKLPSGGTSRRRCSRLWRSRDSPPVSWVHSGLFSSTDFSFQAFSCHRVATEQDRTVPRDKIQGAAAFFTRQIYTFKLCKHFNPFYSCRLSHICSSISFLYGPVESPSSDPSHVPEIRPLLLPPSFPLFSPPFQSPDVPKLAGLRRKPANGGGSADPLSSDDHLMK